MAGKDDGIITRAEVGPYPRPMPAGMFDPMPEVKVWTEGSEEPTTLFSFYPDEISFHADEFVGLTVTQARRLRHDKDVRYLRS